MLQKPWPSQVPLPQLLFSPTLHVYPVTTAWSLLSCFLYSPVSHNPVLRAATSLS